MALALVVAVLGTVMHQTKVGGFPIGLGIALLTVLTVAVSLRKNKTSGWAFFAGMTAIVFYVALDIHPDKMIPANLSGYLWSYGSLTLAAFVAMFPRLKRI